MTHYDHIFIVTNDLSQERRVKRIINVLTDHNRSVLLIGRELNTSIPLSTYEFDQRRVSCLFNSGPLFYFEFYLRVTLLILRRFNAHSITCNDLDTILIGKTLKRFRKFHLYLDCHEWFEEVPELQGKTIKKWIWTWIARRCMPATNERYTVNPLIGEQMSQVYSCDFQVIQNLSPEVEQLNWDLKQKIEPFRLVYLGVLNKGRGLELLIACMEHLPNVALDIIGDGDLGEEIKQLVSNSPANTRIKLHGMLRKDQFAPILERGHVGINLLESTSKSYYYSSANKVHDYLNYGLIVLTMDYPYHRILSEQCSSIRLVASLDVSIIVNAIYTIMDAYDYRVVETSRNNYLDTYNWTREVEKIRGLYSL